jgi:hypothetical protein
LDRRSAKKNRSVAESSTIRILRAAVDFILGSREISLAVAVDAIAAVAAVETVAAVDAT